MSRLWIAIAMIALVTHSARAQIVNVQGALAKAPDHDGVVGQLELKFNWREGNSPLFDIGGAGSVVVRRGDVLGLVLVRGEYGQSRGVALIGKVFEHVRTRITIDCLWRWEAFAQHEYDRFRRLNLRALAGTGPALQVIETKELAVLVGAAYLYEYEQADTHAGRIDAGLATASHRASLYFTGREDLSASASVVQTVYLQPRLDKPSDQRVFGELAVLTRLASWISIKDSLSVAYDRTPLDGVKHYDTALEIALSATF